MSKTLLNRLAMFEVLDAAGPLTISELAQRSGMDVAVVSRTVAACVVDGWLARADGKIAIGPRATLLGHSGPFAEVIARAAPLVHAVAGVTGMLTHANSLVGASSVLVAVAPGREPTIPAGLAARTPLYATAVGHCIAVQLDTKRLDALLPAEPFPDAAEIVASMAGTVAEPIFSRVPPVPGPGTQPALARSRDEFRAQLDRVREDGFAADPGALDPALACIAISWPQHRFPSAIACIGLPGAISDAAPLIRHVLALAVQPASSPSQIITGAAAAIAGRT
jgi:DNA-binding IclR family transcriptional regulator